ncbi:MAG: hypothetical protein O2901_14890 [Verrucomicrobia bacterium]|nr:hypothetical protein [Verrucomicrobiota bacterium]
MISALEKLLQAVTAAAMLLNKAYEKRAALECIVLQANLIDGVLRVGLILKQQLDTGSCAIDDLLLMQSDDDRAISERDIYRRALVAAVIDQPLFDDLSSAYGVRNRCIHRYLLSTTTYDDAIELVYRLDKLLRRVNAAVELLEEAQVQRGRGITVKGSAIGKDFLAMFAAQKEHPRNLK